VRGSDRISAHGVGVACRFGVMRKSGEVPCAGRRIRKCDERTPMEHCAARRRDRLFDHEACELVPECDPER
jgi:hypothetical protein